MTTRKFFLFLFIIFSFTQMLSAQYEKVEQIILFGSRMDNPVKIEVIDKFPRYQFMAENRSHYPYQLTISFTNLSNLSPMQPQKTVTIMPGKTNLLTLTVVNEKENHNFQYAYVARIGIPCKNVSLDFPYLLPVKNGFEIVQSPYDKNTYLRDCFKVNQKDTIFTMRKGFVVAIPGLIKATDRVADFASLEILHDDGTIMVYKNINPDSIFVKIGTYVFPSQPLGFINSSSTLEVGLYTNTEDERLQGMVILYSTVENETGEFSQEMSTIPIVYPREIITREMTNQQRKKFDKGKLF